LAFRGEDLPRVIQSCRPCADAQYSFKNGFTLMTYSQSQLVELAGQYLFQNYRQAPVVMTHGRGTEVWDKEGKRYLDFVAGVAVNSVGHAHPAVAQAMAEQAQKLVHVSNYFFNEPNVLLARRLCMLTGMSRALFCNSGTEAIEACLKLARRYFYDRGERGRTRIIAFERSFHGRTMGALAATGQAGYREGFGPLGPVTHVPYGDLAATREALGSDVAAILVEPVQGEGGVVPAPPGFLRGLRELTENHGSLLIADEIQTGVGRTGEFLGCMHFAVRPDVIALAKGLGGGFPIGAMLCTAALEKGLPPGSHGTTFGGNPLASTVAMTVLDVIESEGLIAAAREQGNYLLGRLGEVLERFPRLIRETRGLGLLCALDLNVDVDARALMVSLREAGLLVSIAGGSALRFSPPLVTTREQIDEAIAIVEAVLGGALA
jgi:acetylornithine/N-succinyldiaminopimelate aminotransferase